MLNSTNIKTWISDLRAVSGAVRVADMSVAAIGAVDYATALDGLSLKQAQLMLTTQGIVGEEQKDLLVKQGLIATSDRMSASLVSEALANNGLNKEKIEEILIDANLMSQNTKELITENAVTEAKLRAVLAEKGIKGAKADTLIASILQTGQNTKEALSWDVLRTKIKMATIEKLKWLVTTPAGWATLVIGAVVGTTVAIAKYNEKLEESRQEMIETGKEAAQLTKDLDGLVEEYRKLGADGKLDNSDREKAYDIQKQINELLGEEVDNINLANGKYEDQLELLKKLQLKKAKDKDYDLETAYTSSKESLLYKANNVGTGWWTSDAEVEAVQKLKEIEGMDKYFHSYKAVGNGDVNTAFFKVDTSSADAVVESYEKMVEVKRILEDQYRDEIKSGGALEDFYNNLKDEIGDLSDAVTKYKEAMSDYNINQAVITFNETEFDVEGLGKIKGAFINSEEAMTGWITSMMNADDVSDGVQAELIALAQTWYPQYVKQINEAVEAQAKKAAQDAIADKSLSGNIQGLKNEASALGITEGAMIELVLAEIRFNKNNLNVSQKISALKELAVWAGVAQAKIDSIFSVTGKSSMQDKEVWAERNNVKINYGADKDGSHSYTYNGKTYSGVSEVNTILADEAIQKEIDKMGNVKIPSGGGVPSGGSKSSSSTKNEALENYLKDAENRYKIHQDETKYIEELQHAHDNLTKDEKERLDIIGKINEAYRDLADNRIKDLEHQIDLKKEAYGEDYDATAEWSDIQRIAHEEAERLRKMGYDDNSNEIQELQKTWWGAENNKLDWRLNNSKNWIEERNRLKDWCLFDDNEVDAWERVVKWLKEEYPHAVDEIKEAEENLFEARQNQLEDAVSQIERHIDKIKEAKQDEIEMKEALLSIREKSYETLNKLAEAQHEADKAIRTSRISYQYLDEDMINQIYNEDDYKRVSDKIDEVQDKLSEDTARFLSEVEDAYAQDKLYLVESITAEYERQCALKERELEILQAEIDLQKKQEQLNNVLAEKNVRLLKDGKWIWTHDADNARQAMEELADAQYEYERQQKEHQQQLTLDSQQRLIDGLTSEVSMLDSQVEKLNEVVENITDPLTDFSTLIDSIVSYGNKVLTDAIGDVHVGASSAGGSKYSSSNPAVKGSPGYYNSNPNYDYTNAIANAKTESEVIRLNNERNNKIDQNGLSYHKMGNTEAVDYWKSKRGYASGTKHTMPGVADFNEGNKLEGLITNDGTLIPMANFAGGEMVFSHEMMENLWHHAQIPWNVHMPNLPDFIPKQTSVIEKGQSFYGDINVYNPTDWNDFMRQLNAQTKSQNAITNRM